MKPKLYYLAKKSKKNTIAIYKNKQSGKYYASFYPCDDLDLELLIEPIQEIQKQYHHFLENGSKYDIYEFNENE